MAQAEKRDMPAVLGLGFLMAVMTLLAFGLLMQFSASISVSEYKMHDPFYYFGHQTMYALLALLLAAGVFYYVPLRWVEKLSIPLMLFALVLLVLVLIPGIGSRVNGSYRWLSLGFINIQASEVAKLCGMVYLAGFFAKYHGKMHQCSWKMLIVPGLFLGLMFRLLWSEPDLGSVVVIAAVTVGLLFISGYPWHKFLLLALGAAGLVVLGVLLSPYRMRRLISFSDPWSDPFDSGFQLSQALIAFGRGEVTGVGLGASIQKYAYLPEAHTDFIFAVVGEELGVLGVCFVIILFLFITLKILQLGKRILESGKMPFSGYLVMAIGLYFVLQSGINMGVNLGALPTKGLTLPFISYGGSSLIVSVVALALVFKANHDMQQPSRRSSSARSPVKRNDYRAGERSHA